jgi:ABC-type oligopeptide transport system substrate-binding subunit
MKSRFTRLCVLACAWMILGSTAPARSQNTSPEKKTFYYWYFSDNDVYHQWVATATEINDLQNMTGLLVNSNQGGGTLIANGYTNNNYPHTILPAARLYTH